MPTSAAHVAEAVREAYRRGKAHAIVVVAEGVAGGATQIAGELAASLRGGDMVLVLGAGDITQVAPDLLARLGVERAAPGVPTPIPRPRGDGT